MILITKEEKNTIREEYPKVMVVRTMKQRSKRHRYYMEEMYGPMQMLSEMRGHSMSRKEV